MRIQNLISEHRIKSDRNFTLYLQPKIKGISRTIIKHLPLVATHSLYLQAILKIRQEILEDCNSVDAIAQVIKCMKMVAQDCASLLLDAETKVGELLKVA